MNLQDSKIRLKNKPLFAGPFVGEFGHELFCWQGALRAMAPNYSDVTIVCTSGKECLYEDFANKLLTYTPQEYTPNGSFNYGRMINYPAPSRKNCHYIPPNKALVNYIEGKWQRCPQLFVKYGSHNKRYKYDYLIHARSVKRGRPPKAPAWYGHQAISRNLQRNWSQIKWAQLLKKLPGKKGSVGTHDGALHIEDSDDLRDLPLNKLCDIFASSSMIIGPSSGPLHLASLCGLPQVTWSGEIRNKKRYKKDWNPHGTPVFYLKTNKWNADVEEVLEATRVLKMN